MQYQRQSSAYDLSAFETKQSAVVKPNLQVIEKNKNKNSQAKAVSLSTVMFVVLLVGMVASILYSNAVINELGNQISSSNEQYTTLQSDYKKLNAKLESKVSLKNVEAYAKDNLGLAKMESYQIEYVNMLPEDKIEYTQKQSTEKITEKILNSVNKFMATDK